MTTLPALPLTVDSLLLLLNASLFDPLLQLSLPLYFSLSHLNLPSSFTISSLSLSSPSEILNAIGSVDWGQVVKGDRYLMGSLGLLGIGMVVRGNNWLSDRARNNGLSGGKELWNWNEEVILITGGSGGIGKETVLQLAKQGIKIVVIDSIPLSYTAPPTVRFYQCDLTKSDLVKEVALKIQTEVGHPTVLINNAGILRSGSILNATARDIDLTYDVNVKAHYYTVQAFLPKMIEMKHGHIITMASSTAYIQAANAVSYCSSKAAALSFHEGLSLELRDLYHTPEIKTSIICPSHVKTKLFEGYSSAVPGWLMPSLDVREVAGRIVEVVKGGRSEFVILPACGNLVIFSRIAPTYLWKIMMLAGKSSMNGVKGSAI